MEAESDQQQLKISVRGIVMYGGKLLCVRQKQYSDPSSPPNDFWNTPGGGLERGESLQAGLAREMMEETGVAADIGNLLYTQQFRHNEREYLDFFFHVTNGKDFVFIDLDKTSHGAAEISDIGFIDVTELPVMPTFLAITIPEFDADAPTKSFSYL